MSLASNHYMTIVKIQVGFMAWSVYLCPRLYGHMLCCHDGCPLSYVLVNFIFPVYFCNWLAAGMITLDSFKC